MDGPYPADEGLGQADPGAGEGHQDAPKGTCQSEGGILFPGQSLLQRR